jgi:hypothetical protein
METPTFVGFLNGKESAAPRRLYLRDRDRRLGLHIIGAPGSGKSKFIEHLIRQDIKAGRGLCFIDPHGQTYQDLLEWCCYLDLDREIIPINFSEPSHIIPFNPFLRGPGDLSPQVDRRVDTVIKVWGERNTNATPRLAYWLPAIFHPLIEADDLTLLDAEYFIHHSFSREREYLLNRVENPHIRSIWADLAGVKKLEDFNDQLESSRNRLNRFIAAETARRFFASIDPSTNLDFLGAMNRGAVILVNLKWSESVSRANAQLFGALFVNALIEAALRRDPTAVARGEVPPFTAYLDEFHNFVTPDIGEAVTQVRKFGLRFVLAHQLLKQLTTQDANVLEEVLTAVRARAIFGGMNHEDALRLVPELFPGQLDFNEVRYIRETVKFWPVYDRDVARGTMRGRADSTMSGTGESSMDISNIMSGHSSGTAFGLEGFYGEGTHTQFDGSSWGESSGSAYGSSSFQAQGRTISEADSEVDMPIFRPVPVIERQPEHFTREDQIYRLAETLQLQYERHCFIRPPDGRAEPLLVPFVKRYGQPDADVRAYEAKMARRAGALEHADVDRMIAERRQLLRQQTQDYFDQLERQTSDAHKGVQRPKRLPTSTPVPIPRLPRK